MGNSMQHPDNNHATHQQHTTVHSTGLESKEKSQNKSGDHPSDNNTANPMNIARTTQNHVAPITPADKERLEEFVMVGTFFTDDSIGLSPPSSPEPKSRDDVRQDEQEEQQQHSGGNSVEPLSSRLKSDEPHTSHRNESLRFNPRDEEEEMIDLDSTRQSPFGDDAKANVADELEPVEHPVDDKLHNRESSTSRQQDGEIMEEFEPTTDEPESCAIEGDEANDPQKAPSTAKNSTTYAIGDHVYQWCSLAGIPGVFQHHGIVIGVQPAGNETYLTIVDFSNVLPTTSSRSGGQQGVDENADPEKNSPPASPIINDNETSAKCDEDMVEESCAASSVASAKMEEGADTTQDFEIEKLKAKDDETLQQSRQKRQRPFFLSTPSSERSNPMYSSSSNLSPTRKTSTQPPRQQRQPFFKSSTSSSALSSAETMLSSSFPDSVRTYTISSHKWHKVVYQANMWQRHFWRSGTCTSVASDPPGLVMARVFFLMEHRHLVPKYHVLQSNCECMAVWCKTGQWSTLQAMSLLSVAAASQVKQATTLAAIAASQQVTVPASGFMGMLGYTTQVSLVSTQPYLLPAIGIYGALTVAVPMLLLNQAQKAWKRTTDVLTQEFWNFAVKEPETFAECITYWSSRSSSEDDDSGRGAVELAVS